ncbi:MAG: carboxymuconolactone decarboxylase family protein [Dehalococcoidales bacterium]|nr:carboxymuconolactone decarboxylase family protein [Dehalococcoidales bacterium]
MVSKEQKTKELIERITRERGFTRGWHKLLAERDPDFMEAYHHAATIAFRDGKLPRKYKEIIAIVMDALTYYEDGLRVHVRNALKLGVTEEEILEALEVTALLSIHHLSVHLPALIDESEKYKKGQA